MDVCVFHSNYLKNDVIILMLGYISSCLLDCYDIAFYPTYLSNSLLIKLVYIAIDLETCVIHSIASHTLAIGLTWNEIELKHVWKPKSLMCKYTQIWGKYWKILLICIIDWVSCGYKVYHLNIRYFIISIVIQYTKLQLCQNAIKLFFHRSTLWL